METYRVDIDSKSYLEVESCLIKVGENEVRVVNLRSVKGHMGIGFNFLNYEKLKELVKTYQRTTDSVELLNVLSRQYNGWNWFEAYDESYNTNRELTKEELMDPSRSLKGEHGEISPCSQIVDVRRFIPEVRATKGRLSPDDLKEHLHEGIRIEVPIDLSEIKYVPIWPNNQSMNKAYFFQSLSIQQWKTRKQLFSRNKRFRLRRQ